MAVDDFTKVAAQGDSFQPRCALAHNLDFVLCIHRRSLSRKPLFQSCHICTRVGAWYVLRAQPVVATPSDIDFLAKVVFMIPEKRFGLSVAQKSEPPCLCWAPLRAR
jgi:hypothetical protein